MEGAWGRGRVSRPRGIVFLFQGRLMHYYQSVEQGDYVRHITCGVWRVLYA